MYKNIKSVKITMTQTIKDIGDTNIRVSERRLHT